MKIAFDAYPVASEQLSGIGTHALNIASRICRQADCELLLYDFLKRRKSAEFLKKRIPKTPVLQNNILPYGVYVEIWNYFPCSYKTLFGSKADIFHFFNFLVPPKVGGKTVNTVHDLVFFTYPETVEKSNLRRMTKNIRYSCDVSDIIICVSENGKKELCDILNVPKEKIRVVYNGVDHSRFNPDVSAPLREKLPENYILYIGTLEPRKNLTTLLKAFASAKAHLDGCSLVITGAKGWEYDTIFEMADKYSIDVRFTGYVPSEELPSLYKGAKAFVFPSLYEGFGIPPLEAMACGTPVITTRTSSLPEVVGDAALSVDNPFDFEALGGMIDKIIYDSATAQSCIQKGFVQAQKFTWDNSARKVMNIYRELY